jgi:hypothetical protein
LFLAYIVGTCSFGFTPRTTLEVVGGEQRLRRIASLIRSCELSFHDLSRVELDNREPVTPRFNMPFEAGLAVMHSFASNSPSHTYFIFEADYRRLQKSLSDLGGTDVYTHNGTEKGVLREISNALVGARLRPSISDMLGWLKEVRRRLKRIMLTAGAATPYSARVFHELVAFTREVVNEELSGR